MFAARNKITGDRPEDTGQCAVSYVPPALDAVWAGLQSLTLFGALSATPDEWQRRHGASQPSTIRVSTAQIAVFGAAAAYGFYKAAKCTQAQASQQPLAIH